MTLKGLQNVGASAWSVERIAYELERYNGFGYHNNHPEVKSPYLWSFTNQYTRGKYVGDHQFDPQKVSDQVGAMALLKQLIINNAVNVVGQADVPSPPPPPPPAPVPTGLFLADKLPFGLRAEPETNAERRLPVSTDMPLRKLEDAVAPWWKVEVTAPDGSKHIGFAQRDWLTEQTVLSRFVPEDFAQTCIDVARHYGTSAHFLLALADAEIGMANMPGVSGDFGPFLLTAEDWSVNNDQAETGAGDDGRFDPLAQAAVAARLVVKLTEQAQANLPDEALATSEQLYLARIFGKSALKGLLADNAQEKPVRDALAPLSAADIDGIFQRRPTLLTAGITVKDARKAITDKLEAGFEKAVALVLKVEPDLVVGPPETTDDTEEVPWMAKAKEELNEMIKEFKPGSNQEIEKYFVVTTIGKQRDDVPWCGAFVSWCIKESNGAKQPIKFSARAADWLENVTKLPGPEYGAVAVMKPLVRNSSGHVGFVSSWNETNVKLLGGNQGDSVNETDFNIADVRGWRMV